MKLHTVIVLLFYLCMACNPFYSESTYKRDGYTYSKKYYCKTKTTSICVTDPYDIIIWKYDSLGMLKEKWSHENTKYRYDKTSYTVRFYLYNKYHQLRRIISKVDYNTNKRSFLSNIPYNGDTTQFVFEKLFFYDINDNLRYSVSKELNNQDTIMKVNVDSNIVIPKYIYLNSRNELTDDLSGDPRMNLD